MELNAGSCANYLTVGCRFVPNDQWFVTHLDTSWKISDVKRWLLAKCLPSLFHSLPPFPIPRPSQRRRTVSPITFASRDQVEQEGEETEDPNYDDYGGDNDDDALSTTFLVEKYRYMPGPAGMASTASIIPTSDFVVPGQYMLLAFSTGQILEDHGYLHWYSLHPHELLELHNFNYVVKLPRTVIDDYVEPYFEAKVWALKTISGPEEAEGVSKTTEKLGRASEAGDSERDRTKKRKTKLQWYERWVVIHKGLFRLCSERNDQFPPHVASMTSLVSLRGAEHLQHIRGPHSSLTVPSPPNSQRGSPQPATGPAAATKRIVCLKFRADIHTPEGTGVWHGQWRRGSKDATGGDMFRKGSAAGLEATSADDEFTDLNDGKGENTVLIVIDMLEDSAYNNILRVLHRYVPGVSSSFTPHSARRRSPRRRSYSPISFASGSSQLDSAPTSPISSPTHPLQNHHSEEEPDHVRSVRYPEWRIEVMNIARRAGLGDVGRGMELAMFGAEGLDPDTEGEPAELDAEPDESFDANTEGEERGRSKKAWGIELQSDSGDSGDESTSECEWECWESDLFSQRARRRSSNRSGLRHQTSMSFSNWNWDITSSPSPEYAFPAEGGPRSEQRASSTLPRRLSSYSSADSLLRRTIKRASPRKRAPLLRSTSPTARTRPMSPLAATQQDPLDEGVVAETGFRHIQSFPQYAYPPPPDQAYLNGTRSPVQAGTRSTVPISMTMTSITSTVSVGSPPKASRAVEKAKEPKERSKMKGKEKEREKDKEKAKTKESTPPVISGPKRIRTRKRSSTVQVGALNHKASSSTQSAEDDHGLLGRKSSDRFHSSSEGDSQKAGDSGSERRLLRPGMLKLSLPLSFAQVAALGTPSGLGSPGRGLSASAVSASTSSFESPQFAHPDSSDYAENA